MVDHKLAKLLSATQRTKRTLGASVPWPATRRHLLFERRELQAVSTRSLNVAPSSRMVRLPDGAQESPLDQK